MPPRRRPRPPSRKQIARGYYAASRAKRNPMPKAKPKKPVVIFARTSKPKPKKRSTGSTLVNAARIALRGIGKHYGLND